MIHLLRLIVSLEKSVGAFAPKGLFELQEFSLVEGISQTLLDVVALQHLARRMACFINMPFFNITVTPAKQKNSVAGHIEGHGSDSQNVLIEIEPDFLRFPHAAIKVLAHEISHKYLAFHRLSLKSTKDDEILTDVAAIYLGFGTFALNGGTYSETYRQDFQTTVKRTVKNGYLDLDESAFVYDIVCRMRGLSDKAIFAGLNKDAKESVRRVRNKCVSSYPPNNLDVSPIRDKIACIRSKLELAELELCNIDKIKILFPGALATKNSEIDSAKSDVVKTRCALRQLENDVDAPIGRVTYPSIPVWAEDVDKLANLSDAHLAVVRTLNGFVSKRVPPDVTSANWDAQTNIIIECPMCGGRMRLPTGKTHIGVACPKCKYAFDYSTTCPEFKWVPPPPFKEHRKPWIVRKSIAVFGAIKRNTSGVPAGIWLLIILAGVVIVVLNLRPLIWRAAKHMVSIQSEKRVAEYRFARQREQAKGNERIAEENRIAEAYKEKLEQDERHEKLPYPESGKVRILDEDKFRDKLQNAKGENLPLSPFKITTPEGCYYLMKLVEIGSKTAIMDIFCHPGETIETYVPDGDYEARMAIGQTWYGYDYRFGAFTAYQKMDTVLHFEQCKGHHVTLQKSYFGNLKTKDITEEDF